MFDCLWARRRLQIGLNGRKSKELGASHQKNGKIKDFINQQVAKLGESEKSLFGWGILATARLSDVFLFKGLCDVVNG